jgi:uncharacterized protein with ParB-like and HNH nuclease domain
MTNFNFNPENKSFSDIITSTTEYEVPSYQRNYSWGKDQLEDLHSDIQEAMNTKENHYMGYLVFEKQNDDICRIIDGQQRFATLSLIILGAIKRFDEMGNENLAEEYLKKYIQPTDLSSTDLIKKLKLKLNKNNNSFYQSIVEKIHKREDIYPNGERRKLIPSNKLLLDTYEFYYRKFKEFDIETINNYLNVVLKRLFFTTITVTDELNAFIVFETLNARGVELSSADLLKNYLFSLVAKREDKDQLEQLETEWINITNDLGKLEITDFIKTVWNSSNKLIRGKKLFKEIKSELSDYDKAVEFIKKLKSNVNLYVALHNPEDEFWGNDETDTAIKRDLKILRLFGITQTHSMLLSAYNKIYKVDKGSFRKLLSYCVNFSFRYNVVAKHTANKQELFYNSLAIQISNGDPYIFNLSNIKNSFMKEMPSDELFRTLFLELDIKDHKLATYILGKIEQHIGGEEYNYDVNQYNIEHIYPKNPSDIGYDDYDSNIHSQKVNKLGNLTLLSVKDNQSASNNTFNEKRVIYENSAFKITQEIAINNDWTYADIDYRQKELAKISLGIWKI